MFPSLTVCNLNQVEMSFLKENGVYGNITKTNLLLKEFIKGNQGNLSYDDQIFVNETIENLGINLGWTFLERSRQLCQNLFGNHS